MTINISFNYADDQWYATSPDTLAYGEGVSKECAFADFCAQLSVRADILLLDKDEVGVPLAIERAKFVELVNSD
jgi:hypothetical protein